MRLIVKLAGHKTCNLINIIDLASVNNCIDCASLVVLLTGKLKPYVNSIYFQRKMTTVIYITAMSPYILLSNIGTYASTNKNHPYAITLALLEFNRENTIDPF